MKRVLGRRLRWRRKPAFLKTSLWLQRLVERVSHKQVMRGPFEGMKFEQDDPGPSYMPQLLGTYEMELDQVIEDLLVGLFDLLVNVGASVGFFAVGLAKRTGRRVLAYEADECNHPKLRHLAELNQTGHLIELRGFCQPGSLQSDLAGAARPFVIMDTDGGEDPLLDPGAVPALRNATVLVETHDFLVAGITERLVERFERTHSIERILTRARALRDLPRAIHPILRPLLLTAMWEHRGTVQTWLLMTPLTTESRTLP